MSPWGRRRAARAIAALTSAVLVALPACGSDTGELSPPAEPPEAPKETDPAGDVVDLGIRPEGIVADAETGLVAVAVSRPGMLVLLDADSGTERRRVELPAPARHLQLARPGGPVLVPSEGADTLLVVALPSGKVIERVGTGDFPHDAAGAADGAVFVTNEFAGTVGRVRDGRMSDTFGDHVQPGGVAVAQVTIGVVDVRKDDLTTYDTSSRDVTGRVRAGEGPTHVAATEDGRLLVTDTRGDALRVFNVEPELREVAAVALPGGPYGIAYDPERDHVWVTVTGRNEVVALDLAADPPREVQRFGTVRPNTVAVDSGTGRVFVAGKSAGAVQMIDP